MSLFIKCLIAFFILLLVIQIILANTMVEGMENNSNSNSNANYKKYDLNNPNNALILAQHNAGNIEYIKQNLDNLQNLNNEVQDISGNLISLQNQVNQIAEAQQNYANQLTGGQTLNITGTNSS